MDMGKSAAEEEEVEVVVDASAVLVFVCRRTSFVNSEM